MTTTPITVEATVNAPIEKVWQYWVPLRQLWAVYDNQQLAPKFLSCNKKLMEHLNLIIEELERNGNTLHTLFHGVPREQFLWKPAPDKWCLLEIVCHLYDEELDDFRTRVKHVLETPEQKLPPSNPLAWVTERKYLEQDYETVLAKFLRERLQSIAWLKGLQDALWDNAYLHPTHGPLKASMFLTNWPIHDYLHIRQIIRTKYLYIQQLTGEDLRYAGDW